MNNSIKEGENIWVSLSFIEHVSLVLSTVVRDRDGLLTSP